MMGRDRDITAEPSRHSRAPLPTKEIERIETLNEKILEALKQGPKTNKRLSYIALDYGRRIRDLRYLGYRIDRERIKGGLNRYTLLTEEEPEWLVHVQITLLDGTVSIQKVHVHGTNEGLVRNRAQHMAHRVKVLTSHRVDKVVVRNR